MVDYKLNRDCFTEFGRPKIKYETRGEAKKIARLDKRLATYKCVHCGFWHVGKSSAAIRVFHRRKHEK